MTLRLTHVYDDSLSVEWNGTTLFRYVYVPHMPPAESPKPYFHPISTLARNDVSIYRPYDHVWHKGLQMTMAVLNGQNFWGGPSYVHGKGYVQLPNNGRMDHQGWDAITPQERGVHLAERLAWIEYGGAQWIDERRVIDVRVAEQDEYWRLDVEMALRNVSGETLRFGSPTTEGRPQAGYGSLFWRGPRSFFKGKVMAAGGLEGQGEDIMGKAAPWLAYTGRHDGTAGTSTLVFIDHPQNPRYPTKWFVRTDPFAAVAFAFSFDEELALAPEETLRLRYGIVIADGALDRERIEALAAHH